MTGDIQTSWQRAGSSVLDATFLTSQKDEYKKFFDTHVNTGVTEGMIKSLSLEEAVKGQSEDTAKFMRGFAQIVGTDNLMFTQEGTWIIPPSMRNAFPDYKRYLCEDNESNPIVGSAAIVFAQNQPIPTFDADGKQIGGFENGDFHGYLIIIDNRTGKKYEFHQTFLEDSNKVGYRPKIIGINMEYAAKLGLSREEALAIIMDPNTKLDSTGQLAGKYTGLAVYSSELIKDIRAFNWNNAIDGSNFNYVPVAALEFLLNLRKMETILWDRELASRECSIKSAPGTTAKQNEPGFEPAVREGFYPDKSEKNPKGTPRYVVAKEQVVDGELETVFTNAYPDADGKLPEGAERVMEYETLVEGKDMQVVKPYNHHGGSANISGADNCFKSVAGMLDNVCAHGEVGIDIMTAVGATGTSEGALQRLMLKQIMGGVANGKQVNVKLAAGSNEDVYVEGQATVYTSRTANNIPYTFTDFGGMGVVLAGKAAFSALLSKFAIDTSDPDLGGVAGKAIQFITQQRQEALEQGKRPSESEMLIFKYGAVGDVLADYIHPVAYAANNNAAPVPQSSFRSRLRRRTGELAKRVQAALRR